MEPLKAGCPTAGGQFREAQSLVTEAATRVLGSRNVLMGAPQVLWATIPVEFQVQKDLVCIGNSQVNKN